MAKFQIPLRYLGRRPGFQLALDKFMRVCDQLQLATFGSEAGRRHVGNQVCDEVCDSVMEFGL